MQEIILYQNPFYSQTHQLLTMEQMNIAFMTDKHIFLREIWIW